MFLSFDIVDNNFEYALNMNAIIAHHTRKGYQIIA